MGIREEQLGKRLRALREARGWTQGELLDAARQFLPAGEVFDRTTVSRLEHGRQWPRSGTLSALARAFGVSPGYLVGHDEPPAGPGTGPGVPMPEPELARIVARVNQLPGPIRERVALLVDNLLDMLDQLGLAHTLSESAPEALPDDLREELGFEPDEADRELASLLLRLELDDEERTELLSMIERTRKRRLSK
jgi:transcriptional regulator with XRE-family HTH domain